MIFYVPNNDEICTCKFVERVSVTKNRYSSSKLTKNKAVAGRHSATKRMKSMDFIRNKKAEKNCENAH